MANDERTIPRFFVSMSTSPTRIAHMRPTIDSIIEQTYKPDRIIVNIPLVYQRTGAAYEIPDWLAEYKNVVVNVVPEDLGPITKLHPATRVIPAAEDVYIATIDDDIRYLPHMLEDFARAIVYGGRKGVARGYSGFFLYVNYDEHISAHLPPYREAHVDVLEGYGMTCYHRGFFGADFDDYVTLCVSDKETRFSDDLVISNYLAGRGVKRVQLYNGRNNRKKIWSDGCVLEIGQSGDALHTGASGLTADNNQRYVNACLFLKGNNLLHFSNT